MSFPRPEICSLAVGDRNYERSSNQLDHDLNPGSDSLKLIYLVGLSILNQAL